MSLSCARRLSQKIEVLKRYRYSGREEERGIEEKESFLTGRRTTFGYETSTRFWVGEKSLDRG